VFFFHTEASSPCYLMVALRLFLDDWLNGADFEVYGALFNHFLSFTQIRLTEIGWCDGEEPDCSIGTPLYETAGQLCIDPYSCLPERQHLRSEVSMSSFGML